MAGVNASTAGHDGTRRTFATMVRTGALPGDVPPERRHNHQLAATAFEKVAEPAVVGGPEKELGEPSLG